MKTDTTEDELIAFAKGFIKVHKEDITISLYNDPPHLIKK